MNHKRTQLESRKTNGNMNPAPGWNFGINLPMLEIIGLFTTFEILVLLTIRTVATAQLDCQRSERAGTVFLRIPRISEWADGSRFSG